MKKRIALLLVPALVLSCGCGRADSKVTTISEKTSPASAAVLATVTTPPESVPPETSMTEPPETVTTAETSAAEKPQLLVETDDETTAAETELTDDISGETAGEDAEASGTEGDPENDPEDGAEEEPEIVEEYLTYEFTDGDNDFISRCAFVGDSICSGLRGYGIVAGKQVVAQGNTAARNIYDFTFPSNGEKVSFLEALIDRQPEYVIFSMGMNDVNLTTTEQFTENYRALLEDTEKALPDAGLIVFSITPIAVGSKFTSNEKIDRYNAALREMLEESGRWLYVDAAAEMKNSANGLKSRYVGSDDGVHLSGEAYWAMLWRLCAEAPEFFADGGLCAPVITGTEMRGSGKFAVSWEPVNGADGYEFCLCGGDGDDVEPLKTVPGAKTTGITVSGMRPGQSYAFAVRAYRDKRGERERGELSEVVVVDMQP